MGSPEHPDTQKEHPMSEVVKKRIGIIGLDHWYIGREAPAIASRRSDAEVVTVAHRDAANRQTLVTQGNIPHQTDDYLSVATDPDVDVVVTACTTAENVELCLAAVEHGKHLVLVKPCAMTVADAERLANAVARAGVMAVPYESHTRFQPHGRSISRWIQEGLIGTPLSATMISRYSIHGAQLDWPGQPNPNAWWMDPARVPGGGWMDHSIYLIDWLRWTLQDEVVAITGMSRTLVHKDLDPQKEDFGVALIEFSRGAIATGEVTWSSPRGNGLTSWQFAGTDGNLVYDGSINPSIVVRSSHGNADATAWQTLQPDSHPVSGRTPHDGRGYAESSYRTSMSAGPLDHLLDCLADGTRPIATIDDSVLTLKACLAFYEASHTGTTVKL